MNLLLHLANRQKAAALRAACATGLCCASSSTANETRPTIPNCLLKITNLRAIGGFQRVPPSPLSVHSVFRPNAKPTHEFNFL
uniref:Putative secreted protein n=1 Tax=Anopheles marajoara TaxID=58244 RepID=A0A2M4CB41_9DIPT